MNGSDIPAKLQIPFAANAGASYIHAIPVPSQIGVAQGAASLNDGFPPACFVNTNAGGSNIDGRDMNGILYAISAWTRWAAAGGVSVYDSTFSSAVGGYPKGAILAHSTSPGTYFSNLVDGNTANPETGGANWTQLVTAAADTAFTGKVSLLGTASKLAAIFANAAELVDIQAAGASGTVNFYLNTSSVKLHTANATANWTLNISFSAGTTLNSALAIGQCVTLSHVVQQGTTAYYATAIQVDGITVTPWWQGGAAPANGNPSGLDVYSFTVMKTANATFTVLAALIQF